MPVAKHGVSTDSSDRLLIDAGAVYIDFLDADSPGTRLGATRGGNSFDLARTVRRIEVDGAKGPVRGLRRIEEVVATIKANMIELSAENLRRAIADAVYSAGTTTITSEANSDGDGSNKEIQLGTTIEDCEDAWNESDPVTGVTSEIDAVDFKFGTNCVKLTMGSTAAVGILATEVISLVGNTLDNYNKLYLWIKSSIALAAGELQILLDDTAECVSPVVTIDLPALVADTWTKVVCDADFSGATGLTIISVGVKQTVDLGAFVLRIDEVKASVTQVEENSETILVNSVQKTRGTDYAMDYDKGAVQFVVAPPDGQAVVCTYTYVSETSTIEGETTEANKARIKDAAYIGNVAIVGTISGKSDPVIIQITNALADVGFNLSQAPKDEAVLEVTFTGHYLASDLATEPWSVEYPAA